MLNTKWAVCCVAILSFRYAYSQQSATVTIDASQQKASVSPTLHGIFFEEISHAGERGLYAELIQKSNPFYYTFNPFSISVLQIKDRGWKK